MTYRSRFSQSFKIVQKSSNDLSAYLCLLWGTTSFMALPRGKRRRSYGRRFGLGTHVGPAWDGFCQSNRQMIARLAFASVMRTGRVING